MELRQTRRVTRLARDRRTLENAVRRVRSVKEQMQKAAIPHRFSNDSKVSLGL